MPDDDVLLTTGEAAALLGSSRQHVVDLCRQGLLAHTSTGTHRRLRRSDVVAFAQRDRDELTREQRRSLWLHRVIAGRIALDPTAAIETASSKIEVMAAAQPRGHSAVMIDRWRLLLAGPLEGVLDVCCSPSPDAAELRQSTPFGGLLSDTDRAAALASFRHVTRRASRPSRQ